MSKNEVSYLAGAEQAIPLERLRPFATTHSMLGTTWK